MDIERRLVTVREVERLDPIDGADRIETATVDGWQVVVKKGEFQVGDKGIYFEIDSWVPITIAPFLRSPGKSEKLFKGVDGERLRTIKLKEQVSQGLLLPTHTVPFPCNIGDDLTLNLGVTKWEKEVPAQLAGQVKGNFPTFLPKTDQPRIQNVFGQVSHQDGLFEITEKLDGSSMTVYLNGPADGVKEAGVCSRNLDLKWDDQNAFWQVAIRDDLINKMVGLNRNIAFQGELIGPGVQGNSYKLDQLEFYCFDIFDIDEQQYLKAGERDNICRTLDIKHAPMLGYLSMTQWNTETDTINCKQSVQSLLAQAEGKSELNRNTEREGLVWKSIENPSVSFKVISNKWLLKEKE